MDQVPLTFYTTIILINKRADKYIWPKNSIFSSLINNNEKTIKNKIEY